MIFLKRQCQIQFLLSSLDKQDKMQILAKFKTILYMGFILNGGRISTCLFEI